MNDEIYYDFEMACYDQNRYCVIDMYDNILLIGSYDECVDYLDKNPYKLTNGLYIDIWD